MSEKSRQQDAQGQQANIVKVDKIIDHAEAWNLCRGRRDQKQQKKKQCSGVALAFSCDGQHHNTAAYTQEL
jgi:hypothetical protein